MAEKAKVNDDNVILATYTAAFILLWYMIVRISRALVCAVWPMYVLAAIGTVKLLQVYRPDEIYEFGEQYYKQISEIVMTEYEKYAPYLTRVMK